MRAPAAPTNGQAEAKIDQEDPTEEYPNPNMLLNSEGAGFHTKLSEDQSLQVRIDGTPIDAKPTFVIRADHAAVFLNVQAALRLPNYLNPMLVTVWQTGAYMQDLRIYDAKTGQLLKEKRSYDSPTWSVSKSHPGSLEIVIWDRLSHNQHPTSDRALARRNESWKPAPIKK